MARPTKEQIVERMEQRKRRQDAVERYSEHYRIPVLTIEALIRKCCLSAELDRESDVHLLELVDRIFSCEAIVRPMMQRYHTLQKRRKMLSLVTLDPAELFVYEKYAGSAGKTVLLRNILSELEQVFGLAPTSSVVTMVRKIRSRVYVNRSRGGLARSFEHDDEA